MSAQSIKMSLYEDHPFAENINFRNHVRLVAPQNKDHWALFNSGRTNMMEAAAPESVEENFPDSAYYYPNPVPNYFGSGYDFNLSHEVVGQRKVRQALAYAVDPRNPADANGYIPVVDNFTGIGGGPAGVPGQVLGDVRDKYVDYDVTEGTGGEDWEKATSLLEEAGFSKEGGTWMRPNGNPFELPITVVAAHSDVVRQTQVVVGQLQEFGIEASMDSIEGATFWDRQSRGDFVMMEGFWVNAFPYNQFAAWYNFETEVREGFGWPPVVEDVPKPFDAEASETVDIDMRSLVQELGEEPDTDRQQELLRRLAWGFNHELPTLPIEERMVGPTYNPKAQGRNFIMPNPSRPRGARGTPIDGEDRATFAQTEALGTAYRISNGYIAAAADNN
jgi:peptide/nickel transport system substrate-binding protein